MFSIKFKLTVLTGCLVFSTILATEDFPKRNGENPDIEADEKIQDKDQQERRVVDDTNGEEIHNIQSNKKEEEREGHTEKEVQDEKFSSEDNPDMKKIPDEGQKSHVSQGGESSKESDEDVEESVSSPSTGEESSQSFFSFKNFVKSLVSPVLEELEKADGGSKSDSKVVGEVNLTESVSNNATNVSVPLTAEVKNKTDKKSKFTCIGRNYTTENASVTIVNNTQLLSILSFDKNETEGDCVLVLFFVPYCRFCSDMAPSFNALARVYPQLNIIAVDAAQFSNLNAKFGTVSVPNILLFHQSRAMMRFNSTEKSFANLVSFVKNATGFEPNTTVTVLPQDFAGPLQSVATETTDYMLIVSWMFVVSCSAFMFVQSNLGQQWINKVKILWQEHQHID
ncbi:thioredoxin domain-containing protein 15-like [Saccostrea echinata]|uniref:thioredoxin domain-containing protein 15-like n=1 Tax=Saccostrea echinata TaxID=191078 RepID=UPI002A7FCAF3|nr:thioredoxin domain-containing protein 15-like [Saccostrea echinata]